MTLRHPALLVRSQLPEAAESRAVRPGLEVTRIKQGVPRAKIRQPA